VIRAVPARVAGAAELAEPEGSEAGAVVAFRTILVDGDVLYGGGSARVRMLDGTGFFTAPLVRFYSFHFQCIRVVDREGWRDRDFLFD
jgi:hypothetical protein